MPELPEVEVTRRLLSPFVLGRTLRRLETTASSYLFLTPPSVLRRRLVGRRAETLDRVGKYLILRFDDGSGLLVHLGMTGQLFADGARSARLVSGGRRRIGADDGGAFAPDLHTHLIFEFRGKGPRVYFRDVRKFGKVAWLAPGRSHERLDKLGVDALRATGAELWRAAQKRSTPIKTLLLDQAVLAGVGNIYADEALFLAGVRSTRRARETERKECDAIVLALRRVMKRSIATGGSSISDYVRPDGSDGGYQNERRVYGREGEPCPRCAKPIIRIVLAQRSAHYCTGCQR